MLLFYCADAAELIGDENLGRDEPVQLRSSLEDARATCLGPILVVDPNGIAPPVAARNGCMTMERLPRAAVQNLTPYRPPKSVTAAGGVVVRRGNGQPDVLMIFRRGVWDLPKGKMDRGETVEHCAVREVKEEVGIQTLDVVRELGTTVHGYADGDHYAVKTTYWFLMQTAETAFRPQTEEDIEQIEWMSWPEAVRRIGYETLRLHLISHADVVSALLERQPG